MKKKGEKDEKWFKDVDMKKKMQKSRIFCIVLLFWNDLEEKKSKFKTVKQM